MFKLNSFNCKRISSRKRINVISIKVKLKREISLNICEISQCVRNNVNCYFSFAYLLFQICTSTKLSSNSNVSHPNPGIVFYRRLVLNVYLLLH